MPGGAKVALSSGITASWVGAAAPEQASDPLEFTQATQRISGGAGRVVVLPSLAGTTVGVPDRRARNGIAGTVAELSGAGGLMVRYRDDRSFWALLPVPKLASWRLARVERGVDVDSISVGLQPTTAGTRVQLWSEGNAVKVAINGYLCLTVTSDYLANEHKVGVAAIGNDGFGYTNVVVF